MPSVGRPAQELVDRFCSELKRVGGHAVHIQSAEELSNYLEELLPDTQAAAGGPATAGDGFGAEASSVPGAVAQDGILRSPAPPSSSGVAVSDGALRLEPGLRDWLGSRGFAMLPSLRECDPVQAANYKRALFETVMGVTTADFAIADTGTLVLVSERNPQPSSDASTRTAAPGGDQHRLISLVPPIHVCLLDTNHIFLTLAELITHVNGKYYRGDDLPLAMTFITGPSRTADIELTLTMGVHGPRELYVLLYDSGTFTAI